MLTTIVFNEARNYQKTPTNSSEFDKLFTEVAIFLKAGVAIEKIISFVLSDVYQLRIKSLEKIQKNHISHDELYQEMISFVEGELFLNEGFEVLCENILFGLRCGKKVSESFYSEGEEEELQTLPSYNYQQHVTIIKSVLPKNKAKKVIDWLNYSLKIEIVLLCAMVIQERKLKISNEMIDTLSSCVVNASQEFYALSVELEIIKSSSRKKINQQENIDNEVFMEEQQFLSSLDLDVFSENF